MTFDSLEEQHSKTREAFVAEMTIVDKLASLEPLEMECHANEEGAAGFCS